MVFFFIVISSPSSVKISHIHTSYLFLVQATIFIDYFKLGLTRNWEPFVSRGFLCSFLLYEYKTYTSFSLQVEPFKCLVLYEKSVSRGKGITFNADCPLHFNVTSALIGE